MNQRGRKSAAALAVVDDQIGQGPIMAPPGLSPAERGVWLATVNSKPADHFGTEHIPLLVEYCRHVCKAGVVDAQVKAFDPEWLATEDGLKRYDRLLKLATKESSSIKMLATAMRLTQHAVYLKDKVIPKPGRKLWQREPSQS